MKNWKTTLSGIALAVGLFLSQYTTGNLQRIGQAITIVASGSLGASSKDSNVTGGTVKQQ